jgi:peptide/nickel transport system ATP-binding protein
MRQRVMIALALSCEPKLIIADEPTTALDVTIQAQILELMKDLSRRLGVALIVITHNLGVVARYADRVNVMYAGKIVEMGTAEQVYHDPKHPYTVGLLASVPRMDSGRRLLLPPALPLGHRALRIRVPTPGRRRRQSCVCLLATAGDGRVAQGDIMSSPQPLVAHTPGGFAKVEKGETLIEVKNLKMYFPVVEGIVFQKAIAHVKAVDDVSFTIKKGETLGLVGESGCGKTTTGRCILQLERPTAGEIIFEGVNLNDLNGKAMSPVRQKIQVIFQDPYSSLNPRMKIGHIIGEPMRVHAIEPDGERRRRRVAELLSICGLDPKFADRYPHEMSGGQRQRVGIARALSLNPEFIICDEAVSALDVSIQAQVINLLEDLREEFDLTYLFIAHDLSVVHHLCNRVAVMYLGKMVELADSDELFDNPIHPYTKALLSAVPVPDPTAEKHREHQVLQGEVPSPMNPPSGCVFHPRCPMAVDSCRLDIPPLVEKRPGHWVACSQV